MKPLRKGLDLLDQRFGELADTFFANTTQPGTLEASRIETFDIVMATYTIYIVDSEGDITHRETCEIPRRLWFFEKYDEIEKIWLDMFTRFKEGL
jgi:hypothetical protein